MNSSFSKFLFLIVLCAINSFHLHADENNEFKVKGIYIDLRTQVMTVDALKALVKEASTEGMNTIIVEYEATFPFDKHVTLCNKYCYKKEEIVDFIKFCSSLDVDVIPLQNCFGHCEYILRHDRYSVLRESKSDMSQVCPCRINDAKEIFSEIFQEIANIHTSKFFHIGADETRLLGYCRQCKHKISEQGVSKLYADYVKEMCNIVLSMGKIPIIWADMILQHPEALENIPKQTIIIDWNYGWKTNHFGNVDELIRKGYTVWGASSLRSSPDNIYLTQWNKHFANIETFIPYARKHGYSGMINTSWSTSGRYGYIYDNNWEVIDIQPIRQVYPMTGFHILQSAFFDAMKSQKWNSKDFIYNYAKQHFGFDLKGCRILYHYMMMSQEIVVLRIDNDLIIREINKCDSIRNQLRSLIPIHNKKEFLHYLSMIDIRINYLKFKVLEKDIESSNFDRSKVRMCSETLKNLIIESKLLRNQFIDNNCDFLKKPDEYFGKWDYVEKMQKIYENINSCN